MQVSGRGHARILGSHKWRQTAIYRMASPHPRTAYGDRNGHSQLETGQGTALEASLDPREDEGMRIVRVFGVVLWAGLPV